jgi:hypothetical protein
MTRRLAGQHPDLAAMLSQLERADRAALVRRVADSAANLTGAAVPDESLEDLATWARRLDGLGWSADESGEPAQRLEDFSRARAATAVYQASIATWDEDASAESVCESIAAIGLGPVRSMFADHRP